MAYDFDWVGETLAIGDEEAQTFVLPKDPSGNQQGIDAPGLLSALTDFVNFGVFNGNFRLGPPDPTQNLDVASSTSGSNFMPGWRFIQSSNTAITATQVRDTSSPSGSNLRFTFAAGAAADEAYAEQIIDIGGSRRHGAGHVIRATFLGGASNGASFEVGLAAQYLTSDGTVVGMPAESRSLAGLTVSAGGTRDIGTSTPATDAPVGAAARYLRVRIRVLRGAASTAATGTVDVPDIRVDRSYSRHVFTDLPTATYGPHWLYQTGHDLYWRNTDASVFTMLSRQLVALNFVLDNIPAGATTELMISDNAIGSGGVPRVAMPWAGSIVGASYRLSGAPTAGTINIQVTVGGSNVWSPWGALGTGASTGDVASQAIDTDTFTVSQGVGAQVVTSGGYTPTTRNIVVTVWVAVNYTGA